MPTLLAITENTTITIGMVILVCAAIAGVVRTTTKVTSAVDRLEVVAEKHGASLDDIKKNTADMATEIRTLAERGNGYATRVEHAELAGRVSRLEGKVYGDA